MAVGRSILVFQLHENVSSDLCTVCALQQFHRPPISSRHVDKQAATHLNTTNAFRPANFVPPTPTPVLTKHTHMPC